MSILTDFPCSGLGRSGRSILLYGEQLARTLSQTRRIRKRTTIGGTGISDSPQWFFVFCRLVFTLLDLDISRGILNNNLLCSGDRYGAPSFSITLPSTRLLTGYLPKTYLSLHAFFLAMTVFPSIQEKVHAELDRVVGSERPPTLDDLEDMPYLRAAVIENYRWCPLTSGGRYHLTRKSRPEPA